VAERVVLEGLDSHASMDLLGSQRGYILKPQTVEIEFLDRPQKAIRINRTEFGTTHIGSHVWVMSGPGVAEDIVREVETVVCSVIDELLDTRWGIQLQMFDTAIG
jgi:hypothetical protein